MKKLPTYLTVLMSSVLVGCDKYDVNIPTELESQEFYATHEEKALQVVTQCERVRNDLDKFTNSLSKQERIEFKEHVSEDIRTFRENCDHAEDGLRDIEYKKEEVQKAEEEKTKKLQRETRKNEIISYLKTTYTKFDSLPWQDAISQVLSEVGNIDDSEYIFGYRNDEIVIDSEDSLYRISGSFELREYLEYGKEQEKSRKDKMAMRFVANQLWKKGLAELKAKKYDELVIDESYCKKDKRSFSACDVWKQAVSEKRAEIVKNYTINYGQLKTDYNQCVTELEDYLKSVNVGKNDKNVPSDILEGIYDTEKNIYAKYPCSEAKEALQKLNLSFDHYEKLE